MVRHSQNGYVSYDRSVLAPFYVGDRKFMFRRGSPGLMLQRAITWFDANIRDINPGVPDDWSYAERPIRGDDGSDPNNDSNHASGTAGDVDATRWPLGREPESYLTADEIRRWRAHLAEYKGCLRWGGDYTGRKDPMHLEVNRDEATCDRVWAELTAVPAPTPIAPAKEAEVLTSVQLDNPTGDTPERTAVLAVDPVGESYVLPKGARAWVQIEAFCPPPVGQPNAPVSDKPRVEWLVASGSKGAQPFPVMDLEPRGGNKLGTELAKGTRRVEVRVIGIPQGGVVTVQVSATGRAA